MSERELLQKIKEATNLVALIGQTVKLRQQGSAWSGLCPFHSEKTPSFSVVPHKAFYHCFGCHKHGDAFTWLMEREGLTFSEAKEQLARAAGIELPKKRADQDFAKEELLAKMRAVIETAQSIFQTGLNENSAAAAYLKSRDISDGFATEAGFGFAQDGWEILVGLLRKLGFSPELIEQTGLAVRNDRGSLRDFMRNRLTIPIRDSRGRIVAFGGRAMGDEKPKYLNTRETPLFKKSETLFGFHRAKGQMRDGALLVEGYFDVLKLHQEGIFQAIAPLGTAVTEEQLKLISRVTKKLVLCFDGDEAGQRATERAMKLALPLGFDVRLLIPPQNEDPDTWCMALGAEGFRDNLRRANDWVGFVLARAQMGRNMNIIADRMEVFSTFASFYSFMPKMPENWSLLQSVAADLRIPKHEINRALNSRAASRTQHLLPPPEPIPGFEIDGLLRPLIILCREEANRAEILRLPTAWWDCLQGAEILQAALDACGDDASLPEALSGTLRKLEASWATKEKSGLDLEKAVINLEAAYLEREKNLLLQLLNSPEVRADPESRSRLEEQLAQLKNRKSLLRRELLGRGDAGRRDDSESS
jgi:DNA primase